MGSSNKRYMGRDQAILDIRDIRGYTGIKPYGVRGIYWDIRRYTGYTGIKPYGIYGIYGDIREYYGDIRDYVYVMYSTVIYHKLLAPITSGRQRGCVGISSRRPEHGLP